MDRLTDNDRALLRSANAELHAAQNVVGFVQAHIGRVYALRPGDYVEEDGTIVRAPQAAPAA